MIKKCENFFQKLKTWKVFLEMLNITNYLTNFWDMIWIFRSWEGEWYSLLLGNTQTYTPMGVPLTVSHPPINMSRHFWQMFLQSHLQTSPLTLHKSYSQFQNPETTVDPPPFPAHSEGREGVIIMIFWLLRAIN